MIVLSRFLLGVTRNFAEILNARSVRVSGGDAWVVDAAIEMLDKEEWTGMIVTMGGIDKAGTMWGASNDIDSTVDCANELGASHVRCACENADRQIGKLRAKIVEVDAARSEERRVGKECCR